MQPNCVPTGTRNVANQPGLVLAVRVAICVPILIADPVRGAAAAVHAGWRGTCAQVAPAAIQVDGAPVRHKPNGRRCRYRPECRTRTTTRWVKR